MLKFINTKLQSDSDSDSDLDSDSDSYSPDSDPDSESSDSDSDSDLDLYFSSSEIHFLREQFKYALMFWLLISLAAALYFHGC